MTRTLNLLYHQELLRGPGIQHVEHLHDVLSHYDDTLTLPDRTHQSSSQTAILPWLRLVISQNGCYHYFVAFQFRN